MNFESIRSTFFPRWDLDHEWILDDSHPECVGFGLCDPVGKIIVVRNDSDVTLIHEIAHAVTYPGHGKKWQNRMEKAAQTAESSGLVELAADLRNDYTGYSDPDRYFKPNAHMVYQEMGDFVLETRGKESFEAAIEWIAESNCMTPQVLLSKYKKLRTVYDEAHRRWPHFVS